MNGLEVRGKTKNENFAVSARVVRLTENRSFLCGVVDWSSTAVKCTKMKNSREKRAKLLFFTVE
mgnify:FL=1